MPEHVGKKAACYFAYFALSSIFIRCSADAAPSFSCEKPNAIEKVICDSEDLSAKDRLLAHFFTLAKSGVVGSPAPNIIETQRKWLADRNRVCGNPLNQDCIVGAYDDRLFDLAVSALFSDHDAAIKEIARQSPKLSNVYEAIFAFVTISDVQARTDTVAPLVNEAYQATAVIPAVDYPGMKFPAHPQPLYSNIPDARAAAQSADTLGTLLWVVSTNRYGDRLFPLRIPCAALVKQPQTVVWLMPRGGGAIDSQSPQSDCAEAMPSLPAFAALANKAQNSHPMQGTIRFSVGAEREADYAAVLTQSLKYLHEKAYKNVYVGRGVKEFEKKNSDMIERSTGELVDYYQKYFNAPPEVAKQDAQAAIAYLLSNLLEGDE